MENLQQNKPWSNPRESVISAVLLFSLLMAGLIILKTTTNWPKESSENLILIYIMVLSILPVVLYLLNLLSEKGGSLEIKGIKLSFPELSSFNVQRFNIPVNIGVPGEPILDSGSNEILGGIKKAVSSDIVVVDLELGKSWWETRLLVLLAGSVHHQKPGKVVFTATDATSEDIFIGWSYPNELLPLLLEARPEYAMIYQRVMAASRQWELSEPIGPNVQRAALFNPQGVANKHSWMATDTKTGLHNKFYAEQLLAVLLGEEVELKGVEIEISKIRLEELFPVLRKTTIDRSWDTSRQTDTLFDSEDEYLAITDKGKFCSLVSRLKLIGAMLRPMVK